MIGSKIDSVFSIFPGEINANILKDFRECFQQRQEKTFENPYFKQKQSTTFWQGQISALEKIYVFPQAEKLSTTCFLSQPSFFFSHKVDIISQAEMQSGICGHRFDFLNFFGPGGEESFAQRICLTENLHFTLSWGSKENTQLDSAFIQPSSTFPKNDIAPLTITLWVNTHSSSPFWNS